MPLDRILIVQTAFIGDVILITPLIRETKKLFPKAEVSVLVQESNVGILKNNPHIKHLFGIKKSGLKSFLVNLLRLKKEHFDLVLTPHRSFRTLSLLWLAGIPQRFGFNENFLKILLTRTFIHHKGLHKARKNLELLSPFIQEELNMQTELFYTDEDLATTKVALKGNRNIVIAPGSVWNTKRWPEEYYVQLCRDLASEGLHLVFIGSRAERDLCDRIISKADIEAANCCGDFSITASAALLSQCNALICNDSGALHISNAVKIPVFAFFGPTVKKFGYFPFGENDTLFEVDLNCRPCGMHGHEKCPLGHHNCMREIKPDQVLPVILKTIRETSPLSS